MKMENIFSNQTGPNVFPVCLILEILQCFILIYLFGLIFNSNKVSLETENLYKLYKFLFQHYNKQAFYMFLLDQLLLFV